MTPVEVYGRKLFLADTPKNTSCNLGANIRCANLRNCMAETQYKGECPAGAKHIFITEEQIPAYMALKMGVST